MMRKMASEYTRLLELSVFDPIKYQNPKEYQKPYQSTGKNPKIPETQSSLIIQTETSTISSG